MPKKFQIIIQTSNKFQYANSNLLIGAYLGFSAWDLVLDNIKASFAQSLPAQGEALKRIFLQFTRFSRTPASREQRPRTFMMEAKTVNHKSCMRVR